MTRDRLLYFPIRKEGILKDFLTLIKNPKASAGFEPAILGTTVQDANHCATEASKVESRVDQKWQNGLIFPSSHIQLNLLKFHISEICSFIFYIK